VLQVLLLLRRQASMECRMCMLMLALLPLLGMQQQQQL
jgi:hypothetical protein